MYNNETKNSQAWWACEELMNCHQVVTSATDDMEAAAESAVGTISELECEIDEITTERDDLQTELEELKEKMYSFDPTDVLTLLDKLEAAGAALVNFSVHTRQDIRKAYGLAEDGTDGSGGNRSDGSSESANGPGC